MCLASPPPPSTLSDASDGRGWWMLPRHRCTPSHSSKLHHHHVTYLIGEFKGKVIHVSSSPILSKDLIDLLPIILVTGLKSLNFLLADNTIIIRINKSQERLIKVLCLYDNNNNYLSQQRGQISQTHRMLVQLSTQYIESLININHK